ncbi:MAG: PQQ-binding-like beta-propeller repeat protein, partial [Phycisphaerales bacterium]
MSIFRRIVVIVLLTCAQAGAADWPGWRGPARNGISPETGLNWEWPASGPKVLWKGSVGTGFSCIAVAGGRAYTLGNREDIDTVFCLNAETGTELWRHSYPCQLDPKAYEGGPMATPAVENGLVFTVSKFGHCFCLNAETGAVIWSAKFEPPPWTEEDYKVWWGYAGSILVTEDRLILPVGTAGLALDKLTGKILWDNGLGYSGYSSPILFEIDRRPCFAFVSGHEIVAAAVADGQVRWRIPWKTTWDQNASDVIISDGRLFVSTGHGVGCALFDLLGSSPVELWRNKNMRTYLSTCALWRGALYGCDDKQLRCIDWQTGEVRWTGPKQGLGSLILAEDRLLALHEDGTLQLIEA